MLEDFFSIVRAKDSKEFKTIEEVSETSVSTINSEDSISEPVQRAKLPKIGSFQSFVQSEGPIENYSSDLFSSDEIHKIAVLDLRILNLDRNTDNILVQRHSDEYRLVPIDHGLSIPDSLEVCSYDLAWLGYDQAEQPFSQKTLDYIESLDIDQDIEMLDSNFKIRPECLRNMKVSSLLLQQGAARGLNLAQIGQILCRPDEDDCEPSCLEKIVKRAEAPETTETAKTANNQGIRKNLSAGSFANLLSQSLAEQSKPAGHNHLLGAAR